MDMDMVRPRKDPWGLSPVGGPWEAWGSLMDLCGRSRPVGPPRSSCVAYVGRVCHCHCGGDRSSRHPVRLVWVNGSFGCRTIAARTRDLILDTIHVLRAYTASYLSCVLNAMRGCYRAPPRVCSKEGGEAVPRTPWPGYGIQPVSGPLTPCTEVFRAVKPRIGNRCTASGDLCIRISGINRVLFSYCFRQFLRFRSDTHCFDCWRLDRDFTVTASLTVYNGNFNAIRHEGSKAFRNCMDASAIFTFYTRNLNPNFSGCRNRIFDFDIPALDLTSFEWTYVLPYARINFPFILPSICLKDMGKTKLIREATCEGHISCRLRGLTIRKRGMYSQYSRRNLGSIICLAFPHVRASVMDHGQEGRVCVITLWP